MCGASTFDGAMVGSSEADQQSVFLRRVARRVPECGDMVGELPQAVFEPGRQDPAFPVAVPGVEAGDVIDHPKPAELGADALQRAAADPLSLRRVAEVRHQTRTGPFQRKPQRQEGVLLVPVAGEKEFGQVARVIYAGDLVEGDFDAGTGHILTGGGFSDVNWAFRARAMGHGAVKIAAHRDTRACPAPQTGPIRSARAQEGEFSAELGRRDAVCEGLRRCAFGW
jgi:hypothetical protein